MFPSRIDRYIFKEIAVPAGLGLTIFTLVLLMGRMLRLVELVINKGVPVSEIFKLFLLLLPAFLVITLPLSLLLGVLLGFSRLSADSEIIALKSSGFSIYTMLRPTLFLGVLVSCATALLTLYAEPAGNAGFRSQVFQIASSRATIGIQPQVFNNEFDGMMLFTNAVDQQTGKMENIFISDRRSGSVPAVIVARQGRIIPNEDEMTLTLRLQDGSIHRRPTNKGENTYQVIRFETYDVNLDIGQQAPAQRKRKTKEYSLSELRREAARATAPEERNAFLAELHQRFTLPFAPLLFALVGIPLGIQSQRSGRGAGFAIGLGVFLTYYLLQSFAETLAVEGGLPPAVLLWIPNLLFLAGGLYLLYLASSEKKSALIEMLISAPSRLIHRLKRMSSR